MNGQLVLSIAPGTAQVILTDLPWPDYKVPGLVGSDNDKPACRCIIL